MDIPNGFGFMTQDKLKMPKSNNSQRETWYGSADLSDKLALWYQDFEGISMHYITD